MKNKNEFQQKKSDAPNVNQFDNGVFNRDINDNWFILSVLNFDADNDNKVVISVDNNLLIKAKEHWMMNTNCLKN